MKIDLSICSATRNAREHLPILLQSIADQRLASAHLPMPSIEVVIADGASTDGTQRLLDDWKSKLGVPLLYVSEKDAGLYDALNKAVRMSTGRWIWILGADDQIFSPTTCAKILPGLVRAEQAKTRVAYGAVDVIGSQDQLMYRSGDAPWSKLGPLYVHEMSLPHQGVFHHRSLFETHGAFDSSFKICADYEFLLRELKSEPAFYLGPESVAKMRLGGVSSDLKNTPTILAELIRAQVQNGLSPSPRVKWKLARNQMRKTISSVCGEKTAHWMADAYRVLRGKSRIWTKPR